ncbi:hypothetical protein BV898_13617 [Hypsibius exemplaris]|uniref:Uncharacterized protein n=1 Tax=Hypsibius exemplaris TaxID=2072580 RepID=A0A1W0WA24_HYPEX|nr:hypothetical protein BV898_13617 [Hypsibius exemplaris]
MGFGGSFIVIFITFIITYVRLTAMHYAHRNWWILEFGLLRLPGQNRRTLSRALSFRETTIVVFVPPVCF